MPTRPHPGTEIRPATTEESHQLADLIATAFEDLFLCRWLVPNPDTRHPILTDYFKITIDHALTHGCVDTTLDRHAVAVWLPEPGPGIDDYDQQLKRACEPYSDRFQALDATMAKHHPNEPHDHLALLAVHPFWQDGGLGGALLAHHHTVLDAEGTAAYLEAVNPASARLYLRHDYEPMGLPIGPDDTDARLFPMWRRPR